jgi:CheY-like chemotaxis protein
MPVMDGWELHGEMELLESLQIKHISVYITSSSIAVKRINQKKYPAILGYLSKPITMNDIELITSKIKMSNSKSLRSNQINVLLISSKF